jgi:hypothetical protein
MIGKKTNLILIIDKPPSCTGVIKGKQRRGQETPEYSTPNPNLTHLINLIVERGSCGCLEATPVKPFGS